MTYLKVLTHTSFRSRSQKVLGQLQSYSGVGRRNESCRHKWLFLGALNGHFLIFTLQIFASVATCGDVATTCPPLRLHIHDL